MSGKWSIFHRPSPKGLFVCRALGGSVGRADHHAYRNCGSHLRYLGGTGGVGVHEERNRHPHPSIPVFKGG
jgi:hypothetical protein